MTDLLLKKGNVVFAIDNFHTGSKKNLQQASISDRYNPIIHDIVNPISIEADEIYNFASPASPVQYQKDPVRTLTTNVVGTTNLLELARLTGAKFFQASTSEIYGDPEISPQPETYMGKVNPIGIRACYDEGKRAAETLCFDYHRQYNVEIRVARIFNTYGPRMSSDDGRVISTFVSQALDGAPLTIFGDGSQTRSFCYVDDLIAGLNLVMQTASDEINPVNVGNPEEMTLQDLAKIIIDVTGSPSEILYLPAVDDDPKRRCPDIGKIKRHTGWVPTISLQEGLRRTAAYLGSQK